jgi:hypothetical protein
MQHTVAIGTNDRQIFQSRDTLAFGLRKDLAMVHFAKPRPQRPIVRPEVETANLTSKFPLDAEHGPFLLLHQPSIPLKPEMRNKVSSALSPRQIEQVQVRGHRFGEVARAEIRPHACSR